MLYAYSRFLCRDDPTDFRVKEHALAYLLANRDIDLRVKTRIREDIINHKLANIFEFFSLISQNILIYRQDCV